MFEIGCVELEDVTLVQAWIADLLLVGYEFPKLTEDSQHHAARESRASTAVPKAPTERNSKDTHERATLVANSRQHLGRTAICMTGQPRSLFSKFPDEVQMHDVHNIHFHANSDLHWFWTRTGWSGQEHNVSDS